MEEFFLVVLFVAVIALFIRQARWSESESRINELSDLVRHLESRLLALERTPKSPIPAPAPAAESQTTPIHSEPIPTPPPASTFISPKPSYERLRTYQTSLKTNTPPAAPAFVPDFIDPVTRPTPPIPQPPTPRISLEERLGRNWLNKLGIITLVIGVALFLGYQLRTLGPLGKSLLGLALSALLLGGGVFLERRAPYRIFARAAIGGGWALAFFVTFALYHVDEMQILHSQALDLVLMLLVAAGMVGHSLRYKSQVVTSLAFSLAFVTVGISHVTLFSLVAGALLAAGLVVVAARERWYELGLAGLIGLYLNHYLWLASVLPNGGRPGVPFADFIPSAALLLFYWLLFRLFFVLRVPLDQRQQLIASLTAILNSAGLLFLLKYQSSHPEWAFFSLFALGTAELIFAFVGLPRWRISFIVLSSIASVLLLAAVPFRFHGAPWSVLWLLEAEILFLAGVRMPESVYRRLGMLANFVAALQILAVEAYPTFDLGLTLSSAARTPDFRAVTALLCATVIFWFNAEFVSRRWPTLFTEDLDHAALRVSSYLAALTLAIALWIAIPASWTILAWLAVALALAVIARRTHVHQPRHPGRSLRHRCHHPRLPHQSRRP